MSKLIRKWENDLESRFETAKVCNGGLFDCDCACAAPPDYKPMADASKEAAEVMAALGREQLAEARRQYDLDREIANQIVQQQLGLMRETERQGKDYYDYMVANQRPVEAALRDEAMRAGSQAEQEAAAARAIADSQGAYTRALNQAYRQARRYGINPALHTSSFAINQAQNTAAMANAAREKERNIGYAKRLDIAGLYRGLPGASQGAYNLSLNAGNSAMNNQMAPGQQLLGGMAQGISTIGQGQNMYLGGLGAILNSQTTSYNASLSRPNDDPFGAILGAGARLGAAWLMRPSDLRLKQDVVAVGVDERTGLTLYEFAYKDEPTKRYIGVMAHEVERVMPEAVTYDDNGYAMVNYAMLGIEFKEVNHGE